MRELQPHLERVLSLQDFVKNGSLRVRVKPNSRETVIEGFDPCKGCVVVKLKARPEKGLANKELLRLVSKELGRRVRLKSGASSKEKLLLVE